MTSPVAGKRPAMDPNDIPAVDPSITDNVAHMDNGFDSVYPFAVRVAGD
jgi:hypothetical protein